MNKIKNTSKTTIIPIITGSENSFFLSISALFLFAAIFHPTFLRYGKGMALTIPLLILFYSVRNLELSAESALPLVTASKKSSTYCAVLAFASSKS